MLAGYGNIWISDGGAMLERSVADACTGLAGTAGV